MSEQHSGSHIEVAAYPDAASLLEAACHAATRHLANLPAARRWYVESPIDAHYRPQAIDMLTGHELSRCVAGATGLGQFLLAAETIELWLSRSTFNSTRSELAMFPLPAKEILRSLVDKIIDNGWTHDYNSLVIATQGLQTLFRPQTAGRPSLFAASARMTIEKDLRNPEVEAPDFPDKIVVYSALTDAGALREEMWGKIGIMAFSTATPFAITEEVYRRFVLEKRDDCYAPVSDLAHLQNLGSYCLTLLLQAAADDSRHQGNAQKIISLLGLNRTSMLNIPLRRLVGLADRLGADAAAASQGPKQHEPLDRNMRSSVSTAIGILLEMTRWAGSPPSQAYQDSVHTEILHAVCLSPVIPRHQRP